jgi:hypothetical protein
MEWGARRNVERTLDDTIWWNDSTFIVADEPILIIEELRYDDRVGHYTYHVSSAFS